jgi:CcmD family protein
MNRIKTAVLLMLPVLILVASATALTGQEIPGLPRPGAIASQSLRPYWHVFIAYTIAIVLVLGWVVSIGRRLRDIEERLGD